MRKYVCTLPNRSVIICSGDDAISSFPKSISFGSVITPRLLLLLLLLLPLLCTTRGSLLLCTVGAGVWRGTMVSAGLCRKRSRSASSRGLPPVCGNNDNDPSFVAHEDEKKEPKAAGRIFFVGTVATLIAVVVVVVGAAVDILLPNDKAIQARRLTIPTG
jgi:hypothetical protein